MKDGNRDEQIVVSGEIENQNTTNDNQINNQEMEGVKTPEYVTQEDFTKFMREFLDRVLSVKEQPQEKVEVKDEKPKEKTYEDYTNW